MLLIHDLLDADLHCLKSTQLRITVRDIILLTMPRSTSDSFRDNEIATSTFATPFGTPFFGWTEDGEWKKFTMDELRSQYEAWESKRVGE